MCTLTEREDCTSLIYSQELLRKNLLFFIILAKLKRRPTKEDIEGIDKYLKELKQIKVHSIHWTLGRYDAVVFAEAPDEKAILAFNFNIATVSTETLVAIPREEALKAVGLR